MSSRLVLGVRWGKWLEAPAWLPAGAAPADCLNDFRATDSELSVFLVPSDADPEQAAIALAGTRQKFERYGYIVFSTDVVTALGIGVAVTLGDTPDPVVDAWHRDLVKLSSETLARLATRLWAIRGTVLTKVQKDVVKSRLVAGVRNRQLDINKMDPEMQQEINRIIAAASP